VFLNLLLVEVMEKSDREDDYFSDDDYDRTMMIAMIRDRRDTDLTSAQMRIQVLAEEDAMNLMMMTLMQVQCMEQDKNPFLLQSGSFPLEYQFPGRWKIQLQLNQQLDTPNLQELIILLH